MKNKSDKNLSEFITTGEIVNKIDPEFKDHMQKIIFELKVCFAQANIDEEKLDYLIEKVTEDQDPPGIRTSK